MAGQSDRKTRQDAKTNRTSVNKENAKENLCGKCLKGFTTPGERVMNCDMCNLWFHGKCTTLSDELIKEIDSINQIKWFCISCESTATQLLKIQKSQQDTEEALNALIERYNQHIDECAELITKTIDDTLQTQIDDKLSISLQKTIEENIEEESMEEKVQESITKVIREKLNEMDIDSKIDEKLKAMITEKPPEYPNLQTSFAAMLKEPGEAQSNLYQVVREGVKEEVSEQKQIEALRMNLVITGIPEKPNPQTEIQEVKSLFEHELDISPDINKTERIGKPRENEPRLLRVTFTTMRSRREVLLNSINLRNSVNKTVREKVFVRPDMTETQRKESKNLRELLRKMKQENPTKNYMIKRNQVIEKPASLAVPPQQ